MDPLLIHVPEIIETPRLWIRAPRSGEAPAINSAVNESFDQLHAWMPWAKAPHTLEETEAFSRKSLAAFVLRQELNYRIYLKENDAFGGCISLFKIDWSIPKFEIGYWLATRLCGRGYMTEAVGALTATALGTLKGNRVEIRCDENNVASRKVPERVGYRLEGILRNDSRTPAGELRNTCVYAVTAADCAPNQTRDDSYAGN